ncbi:MAG: PIN domain-containing protein [Spirochaetaceae bacterium]|jgi:predicted nucleic acid-binding protein|nr:PIN domain-containing protein [Spirochaetaceae bacterium]
MKSLYLLDTNIISEIRKPYPNENVVKTFLKKKNISDISSITWAESLSGVKRMPEGKKKDALLSFYNEIIYEQFDIIPFDEHSAIIYSDIFPKLEALGLIPQEFDLQIASIAIANNMILVTRNTKDFEGICSVSNLMIENWFEES